VLNTAEWSCTWCSGSNWGDTNSALFQPTKAAPAAEAKKGDFAANQWNSGGRFPVRAELDCLKRVDARPPILVPRIEQD